MRLLAAFGLLVVAVVLLGVAVVDVMPLHAAASLLDYSGPRTTATTEVRPGVASVRPNDIVASPSDLAQRPVRPDPPAAITPWSKLGDVVHNVITVEGKQIPLPSGDWQVVSTGLTGADAKGVGAGRDTNHAGPVVSVVLLRVVGNHADAAILIQTNRADGEGSWGQPTGCARNDFYSARIRYASDHDGSCAYIAFVDATSRVDVPVDPAWRGAVHKAAASGVRLPMHWLVAAFRVTDPRDGLQVRYFFAPWESEAHSAAEPRNWVDSLTVWSDFAWPAVGSGFRNRLATTGEATIPTWPASSADFGAMPTARPTIGEGEYKQVGLIGLKTITYRIFGSMTDFSVNYFYLGSAAAAGSLSILGAAASSVLYFVHELAWSYADAPAHAITDLPGIGSEEPGPSEG